MMKKLIAGWMAALCLVTGAAANTGGEPWDKFPTERVTQLPALPWTTKRGPGAAASVLASAACAAAVAAVALVKDQACGE